MKSDWTIVTVTYNSADQLRRRWRDYRRDAARWIVVDNASLDDSVATARRLGADVLPLSRNLGFARANNIGLSKADTNWVAFVNPDVEVRYETLDRLAELAGRHQALVAPQLIGADGQVQPNGRGFPFLVDKLAHRGVKLPGARMDQYTPRTSLGPTYVSWAIGAVVGGRRSTFDELGGWDERYFLYYEDHDLGLRSWLAGHPVIVDPSASWIHDWQRATTRLAVTPWCREVASATRFFVHYPEFLLPRRRHAAARHAQAAKLMGKRAGTASG
jgi:GT2 family glycosyltransferase